MNGNYIVVSDEYMIKVIKQFESATDEKVENIHFDVYLKTLSEWVKLRQKAAKLYKLLLLDMKAEYENGDAVEIGKGRYDTIVSSDMSTAMITPYTKSLDGGRIIIPEEFKVLENGVILTDCPFSFTTYMTQNPYLNTDIENFEYINGNLIFGVYGSKYDKDKSSKIELLYNLNKRLENNCTIDGGIIEDKYCYALVKQTPSRIGRR